MLILYTAEICPFAQRPRALLTHLGAPFEERTVDLAQRDPAFLGISPTGLVPLLLDGDLKLYESQVIIEYLADRLGWKDAFSADTRTRARQKLAMKQWDGTVAPAWYRSIKERSSLDDRVRQRVEREIDELAGTVRVMDGAVENLLAFHCAPFWARMSWLRGHSPLPEWVEARPALREWLDRTVSLPAVRKTLPDREVAIHTYLQGSAQR